MKRYKSYRQRKKKKKSLVLVTIPLHRANLSSIQEGRQLSVL